MADLKKVASVPSPLEEQLQLLVNSGSISEPQKLILLRAHHEGVKQREEYYKDVIRQRDERIDEISRIAEERYASSQKPQIDERTGLYTGTYFGDLFFKIVENMCLEDRRHIDRRAGCPTLMYGDVRKLKLVNDLTQSHKAGDQLLEEVGSLVNHNLRRHATGQPMDIAGRVNDRGDEIQVLLVGLHGPKDAGSAASRYKDAFLDPARIARWRQMQPVFEFFPPNVDFGAAALKASSLRGLIQEGMSSDERQKIVRRVIGMWTEKADGLMYGAKHGDFSHVNFAWYEYRRDGGLVDITSGMPPEVRRIGQETH